MFVPACSAAVWLLAVLALSTFSDLSSACGVLTHIEIGHRASFFYDDKPDSKVSYKELIAKHQDAFQAGNPYPDAFYPGICYVGEYQSVSEDSHWTPFMVTTIDYIREKYPQPWNETAEKLVVFLLGFTSHQIADVLWHNLGVQDGFLQEMANTNYHGDFNKAHPVGDVGGDVVGAYEWNKTYVENTQWYVPSEDLSEIYKRYYDARTPFNVSSTVIETCTHLLFLARLGEKGALRELFPEYAKKSPFLVDELNEYFIGGVDDNAAWTTMLWHDAVTMLENGTKACAHSKNPVSVSCTGIPPPVSQEGSEKDVRSVPPTFKNIADEAFADVERVGRGIVIKPSAAYLKHMEETRQQAAKRQEMSQQANPAQHEPNAAKPSSPTAAYYSVTPYARLGAAFSHGDFNNDTYMDLAIGAPGFSSPHLPLAGRVYIVFGTDTGLPSVTADIDSVAKLTLHGTVKFARFGSAIASLDFNLDGLTDIVIGAPSTQTEGTQYRGAVHIFLNAGHGAFPDTPSISMAGSSFHENFGWALAAGDMNGDGKADLLVSSPFLSATDTLRESGKVQIYLSRANPNASGLVADSWLNGPIWNGWFGHSIVTATSNSYRSLLAVGAPNANQCMRVPDCSKQSADDKQSSGHLVVYSSESLQDLKAAYDIIGWDVFDRCGSDTAFGRFFPGVDVMAIACPTANITAHVLGIPTTLQQAGRVFLVNVTDKFSTAPFAVLEGDRAFGRFGATVSFGDVTGDGLDELIVTQPLRINDFTEHLYGGEQGTAYAFEGGSAFEKMKWPFVTSNCGGGVTLEAPCPAKVAAMQMDVTEGNSRFGSSAHLLPTASKKATPVIAAAHSSLRARMAGTVYLF
ncbi:phosphatidylinositol-glycan-specific phospholipase D-like [Sycon ciliatum]|uniref:phosphatidylinositol-glycan-specific phospholipase D-like n=1 Tax=Sycon ciliatum TaxID=27933 RepID=UPI0020AB9D55|eukprot:scpid10852/ scgid35770/ Phosphatidylinositol-glycan-specific phospholipase D; Glycoprotein phospholipase D; Glycosyl-phosphatidylinositol-specific phospholipase D